MNLRLARWGSLFCAICLQSPVYAEAPQTDPSLAMQSLYERVKDTLNHPTPENPFYLHAENSEERESGEAAVFLTQSLSEVSHSLGLVSNWCNILPLHINVKACTYNRAGDRMTLYMGRKIYQEPGDAYELVYRFHTINSENYFAAIAHADEGPMKTSDYQIKLEFMSINDKTFGRIFVSNKQSWLSRQGMDLYLSTIGKNKQGIKVIDRNEQGELVYSHGAEGVAERNLVRYYFAFLTFLDSNAETDTEQRYENQLNDWFNRIEQYPQLYEMSRQDYLDAKHKERANQLALQGEN